MKNKVHMKLDHVGVSSTPVTDSTIKEPVLTPTPTKTLPNGSSLDDQLKTAFNEYITS
jgi:hypothetical protein